MSSKLDDIKKVVERNIQRMFAGVVQNRVVDSVSINGKTMRDTMIEDRQQLLREGRRRAPPEYFGNIKKQFVAALLGTPVVPAVAPNEVAPPGLDTSIAACRAIQRRHRKQEPLMHWLSCRQLPLSQASVVKLVDLLLETHYARCVQLEERRINLTLF